MTDVYHFAPAKDYSALPVLAFDTETELIAPGRLAPALVCTQWHCKGQQDARLVSGESIDVLGAIQTPYGIVAGHNIPFDFAVLIEDSPQLGSDIFHKLRIGEVWDTGVFQRLQDIETATFRPKYSLEALIGAWFKEKIEGKHGPDVWRLRYAELKDTPVSDWPIAASEYALNDARYTLRLTLAQMASYCESVTAGEMHRQCRADFALHLTAAWGLRTNAQSVAALKTRLKAHVDAALPALKADGIIRPNGTQNMERTESLVRAAYAALGDECTMYMTPGGKPKTDKGAMEDCKHVCPTLALYHEVAEDWAELDNRIPVLEQGVTLPINCRYDVLKDTGRTSASNPPIQQQPRRHGVRECFEARTGKLFASADYNCAELVSLAQVLITAYGQSAMADAINRDLDLHILLAADLLGCTYEDAYAQRKDATVKDRRQLAKAANFGFPGGLGIKKFIKYAKDTWKVVITEAEAHHVKGLWFARFPEMRQYFADITALTADTGTFTAVQYKSGRRRAGVRFPNGCNTFFQGLTADVAKSALWEVVEECFDGVCSVCDGELWVTDSGVRRLCLCNTAHTRRVRSDLTGARPVAFLHDEILLECAEATAHDAAMRLSHVMVRAARRWISDVKVKADPALTRVWMKGADATFKDGRLVVTEYVKE